jgi:hypothetical protein
MYDMADYDMADYDMADYDMADYGMAKYDMAVTIWPPYVAESDHQIPPHRGSCVILSKRSSEWSSDVST